MCSRNCRPGKHEMNLHNEQFTLPRMFSTLVDLKSSESPNVARPNQIERNPSNCSRLSRSVLNFRDRDVKEFKHNFWIFRENDCLNHNESSIKQQLLISPQRLLQTIKARAYTQVDADGQTKIQNLNLLQRSALDPLFVQGLSCRPTYFLHAEIIFAHHVPGDTDSYQTIVVSKELQSRRALHERE